MPATGPEIYGLSDQAYEQWLWQHVRRVLSLEVPEGLAIGWGAPASPHAKALVLVPKDSAFLAKPDVLKPFSSPSAATSSLTVRPGGPPSVTLDFDILSWIGWFVSRAEEYETGPRDRHGRFPCEAALAQRLGLTEAPIADLLALRLREAIQRAAAAAGLPAATLSPWPSGKHFAACLTHDVDGAIRRSLWQGLKMGAAAGLGLAQGNLRRARRRWAAALGVSLGGRENPYWVFDTLAGIERRHGFRSAFYLLPHEQPIVREGRQRVRRYDVRDARLLETVRRLAAEGWEIGLHTSYDAHDRDGGMAEEWERLGRLLGNQVLLAGGRSHYLRFSTPQTWLNAAACGMQYDATLGWAEGSGFRSGSVWPYRPFDRRAGRPVPLWELGTHLMDSGFTSLEALVAKSREVLDRTAEVGGCACLLFHANSLPQAEATVADFMKAYETVLDDLTSRPDVWVATPREVVERLEHFEEVLRKP